MISPCTSGARLASDGNGASRRLKTLHFRALIATILASTQAEAADKVRISNLSDLAFGTMASDHLSGMRLLAKQMQTEAGAGAKDDYSKGTKTTANLVLMVGAATINAAVAGTFSRTLTILFPPN